MNQIAGFYGLVTVSRLRNFKRALDRQLADAFDDFLETLIHFNEEDDEKIVPRK